MSDRSEFKVMNIIEEVGGGEIEFVPLCEALPTWQPRAVQRITEGLLWGKRAEYVPGAFPKRIRLTERGKEIREMYRRNPALLNRA